ncbi:MAG: hypothetical protein IJI16_04930 [Atopobiaceae bacterium]|nr:hypothetical protein [Atopobiaceae bacterium]
MLIYATLDGIECGLTPPEALDLDLFQAGLQAPGDVERLPESLDEARQVARESDFISRHVPAEVVAAYCGA